MEAGVLPEHPLSPSTATFASRSKANTPTNRRPRRRIGRMSASSARVAPPPNHSPCRVSFAESGGTAVKVSVVVATRVGSEGRVNVELEKAHVRLGDEVAHCSATKPVRRCPYGAPTATVVLPVLPLLRLTSELPGTREKSPTFAFTVTGALTLGSCSDRPCTTP